MQKNDITISKFLSLVLRHRPDVIGVQLDQAGWVSVDALLEGCARHGTKFDREQLKRVVATNDKKRFEFNTDSTRVRASQGHSVTVDLQYQPSTPPDHLYHGTVARFLPAIRQQGLLKGQRHHVHLSKDQQTAQKVGERRGEALILGIRAGEMHRDGFRFFCSTNGVWLTDSVPPRYIIFPEQANG